MTTLPDWDPEAAGRRAAEHDRVARRTARPRTWTQRYVGGGRTEPEVTARPRTLADLDERELVTYLQREGLV